MYIFSIYLVNLPFTAHDRQKEEADEGEENNQRRYSK